VADNELIDRFEDRYTFSFDDYQRRASKWLSHGSSVLVAAPTGAGKTVVGEFAAWLALNRGGKCFYTTPIKALSNQKYSDFVSMHGSENVGLLTGDNTINSEAPVVVMTTEVLRNMLYEDSPTLGGLHYVVLDEVHYLQDRYRGAVWEEIFIHLPVEVLTVSLSATVSNTEEFAEWQQTLRGRVDVLIEEQRPVEIRHWYFATDELLPMFVRLPGGELAANPRAAEFDRRRRRGSPKPRRKGRRTQQKRARIPLRSEVVDRLASEDMLPAIYFIFSRKGCDAAVEQCLRENLRLTTPSERRIITDVAETRVEDLSDDELDVLGYTSWLVGLQNGIAAHHAGMIPPFKETVEDLFEQGLVKVVFATETLALGINMPARSVVIESLTKFTGDTHELMTPGEYTQLSGRAGRRGIDEVGNSIVLMQRYTNFDTITRLASTRTYPLRSSFQPSYNMAVNLVRNYEREEAEHLVNSSFAQFQADRDIVQLEQTRERQEAYLASYRERMHCDRGDILEYREILRRFTERTRRAGREQAEVRETEISQALESLRPGDVVDVAAGKRSGRLVVVDVSQRRSDGRPRLLALSAQRTLVRLTTSDLRSPPRRVTRIGLPRGANIRDARGRRHLARKLAALEDRKIEGRPPRERAVDIVDSELAAQARAELESHPCHSCPDLQRHLHLADRAANLEREIGRLSQRIARRSATLARRFQRVLTVLEGLDYVKDWTLTERGETLTQIYNESDLLVVEALERGLFQALDPAELVAVASTLVYESRGPERPQFDRMPTDQSQGAWLALGSLWRDIRKLEEEHGVDLTREPDPGFAELAHAWASGWSLGEVLDEDDAPGDFVRSVKQLVDLLRQLGEVIPPGELRNTLSRAVDGLHRGVVAYSSLEI
jgi:ATP-dependent RNA helicase HelY